MRNLRLSLLSLVLLFAVVLSLPALLPSLDPGDGGAVGAQLAPLLPDPGDVGAAMAGVAYLVNPFPSRGRKRRHKRKSSAGKRRARRASNPFKAKRSRGRRRRVHMRRNPSSAFMRDMTPVAVGALGALGTDVIVGFVPWPAMVEASPFSALIKTGVKAGIAVGVGWGVGQALGRPTGARFMAGALTVITYGLARDLLQRVAPQLSLGNLPEADFPQIGYMGENFALSESMEQFPALSGDEEYEMGEVFEQA